MLCLEKKQTWKTTWMLTLQTVMVKMSITETNTDKDIYVFTHHEKFPDLVSQKKFECFCLVLHTKISRKTNKTNLNVSQEFLSLKVFTD